MTFRNITTKDGQEQIKATDVGQLFVHRAGSGFGISHIPTGLSVARVFHTKRDALAAAKEMDELCDFDSTIKSYENGQMPNVINELKAIADRHSVDRNWTIHPLARAEGDRVRREYAKTL